MKRMTRKWSSIETVWQSNGMFSVWLRSVSASSELVRLAETMLDSCSRLGLSVSLETVRTTRVSTQRRIFLQSGILNNNQDLLLNT